MKNKFLLLNTSILKRLKFLSVIILSSLATNSQVSLLKDINPNGNINDYKDNLNPNYFIYSGDQYLSVGNAMYFTANDSLNGTELWRTDGTTAGTYMVKDINPGIASSSPREYTLLNGIIYFTAIHPDYGRELWRTDGTANGTYLVKDVYAGTISGVAQGVNHGDVLAKLTATGNSLYFFANSTGTGVQLWKSDGTGTGTVQVTTTFSNPLYTSEQKMFAWGNTLVFSLNHAQYGFELWKTDGTEAGTTLIKDIHPTGNSLPSKFAVFGNKLIFTASDGVNGNPIWISDGTTQGTNILSTDVKTTNGSLIVLNNKILFSAPNLLDNKRELWESDGTSSGTKMLVDINPNGSYNGCDFTTHAILNGFVYFPGNSGTTYSNIEIWRTDGTVGGTSMVCDLGSLQGNPLFRGSNPEHIFTDGKAIYFEGQMNENYGKELLVVYPNGTGDIAADVNAGIKSSDPQPIAVVNGKILFTANDSIHGHELWVYTPTTTGIESGDNKGITVKTYPNPNSGDFTVKIEGVADDNIEMVLLNTLGQVLLTQNYNSTSIHTQSLSNLPKGVYYLKLSSKGFKKTERVVVN